MRKLVSLARSTACVFACLLACVLGVSAQAQSPADKYPDRQIRIIVPYPPGGSVDVLGRLIAQRMQENWGQTVIVENRPGAGTMIGTAAAAKSDPDGYTLIVVVSGHTINPALYASMQYDGIKDFAPIALLARTPVVLYAHPSLPAKDAKELVALGKAKTHTLNFGSAGTGSMTHLTGELLKTQAGIEMLHIVYRGGTPAMNDLLAGHLPLQFATVAQALPQYKAGQLRALGISSAERYASVPEIPTFKEQGIDVVTTEWYGLLAPAGTPRPIVDKLNAEMKRITSLPGMGDRLSAIELTHSTPEELGTFIRAETERWGVAVKKLGLKGE
jgi:tripartite-type tricarboxylate transporter receptor subunit TctC